MYSLHSLLTQHAQANLPLLDEGDNMILKHVQLGNEGTSHCSTIVGDKVIDVTHYFEEEQCTG